MLIHITPKFHIDPSQVFRVVPKAHITRIDMPELDLSLCGRKQIAARRPYPNKHWFVACRRVGHKAINGLLIRTETPIRHFTVVSHWAVDDGLDFAHTVHYTVADSEFDAVSSEIPLWRERAATLASPPSGSPLQREPCMEMVQGIARQPVPDDTLMSPDSLFLADRTERFVMPTIDPARLTPGTSEYSDHMKLPPIAHAFKAATAPVNNI